jgi:hypothetical protein
VRVREEKGREVCLLKKSDRQTCVVFLTAREEEPEEEKEKNAKISALLPFSVSSSLLQQTYHPRATIFITLVTIT